MIDSGISAFVRLDVLGVGANLLLGEAVKQFTHHRKVLAQVARTRRFREAGEKRWRSIRGHKGVKRLEPRGFDAPEGFSTEYPVREIREGHREKGRDQLRFVFALGAVAETGPGRREGARRVGEVVGETLVLSRRPRCAAIARSAPSITD